MARSVILHLKITQFDLVLFYQSGEIAPDSDFVISHLLKGAVSVTRINRKQPSLRQLRVLLEAVGTQSREVFLAQIDRPFVLALFRLWRGMRLYTFDEGGYNVAPDGPFHKPPPRKVRRPRDVVEMAVFPRGPLNFVRRKTLKHYTAFPVEINFLSARAERIDIPWASFVHPDEVEAARSAQKIMVLPCMKDFSGPPEQRAAIVAAAQDCDLVVRHPRDDILDGLVSTRLRSPIEGIICAAAEHKPISVLHYASTVRLTLSDKPRIDLFDMSSVPPRLEEVPL